MTVHQDAAVPEISAQNLALLTLCEATHLVGETLSDAQCLDLERSGLSVEVIAPLLLSDLEIFEQGLLDEPELGNTPMLHLISSLTSSAPVMRSALRRCVARRPFTGELVRLNEVSVLEHGPRTGYAWPGVPRITELLVGLAAHGQRMPLPPLFRNARWTGVSAAEVQACFGAVGRYLRRSDGRPDPSCVVPELLQLAALLPDRAHAGFLDLTVQLGVQDDEALLLGLRALRKWAKTVRTLLRFAAGGPPAVPGVAAGE